MSNPCLSVFETYLESEISSAPKFAIWKFDAAKNQEYILEDGKLFINWLWTMTMAMATAMSMARAMADYDYEP